jgi:hypothetical protein
MSTTLIANHNLKISYPGIIASIIDITGAFTMDQTTTNTRNGIIGCAGRTAHIANAMLGSINNHDIFTRH